jgi:hypothetical protein
MVLPRIGHGSHLPLLARKQSGKPVESGPDMNWTRTVHTIAANGANARCRDARNRMKAVAYAQDVSRAVSYTSCITCHP